MAKCSLPEITPAPQVRDLTAAGLAAAARSHPVALYLSGVQSPHSRATILSRLDAIARTAGAPSAWQLDWSSLHFEDIQILRANLVERYAFRTVNSLLSALRGVLRACWQLGHIDSDSYMRAREVKPVRGHRMPAGRTLTAAEQAALFGACHQDPKPTGARDAAALALLIGAGLRRREAAGLTVGAVDFEQRAVRIIGKGNRERQVPLPAYVLWAIDTWLARRGAPVPADALFHKCRGRFVLEPVATDGKLFSYVLTLRCAQAGIARCTPHDLRRTYITDLLAAGVDAFLVQRLAGHANPATTALYDRRHDSLLRDAVNLIPDPMIVDEAPLREGW